MLADIQAHEIHLLMISRFIHVRFYVCNVSNEVLSSEKNILILYSLERLNFAFRTSAVHQPFQF